MALIIVATGLVSCGDDEGSPEDSGTASPVVDRSATPSREAILIETKLTIPTGEVLSGSVIGDSPFCAGGTFRDEHGNAEVGSVLRTFSCPEGELKIGFSPGPPVGPTQTGPWYILRDRGTGSFEGLRGNGQATVNYEDADATRGRETFTGTVNR
jgi:hypothetical protein